MGSNLLNLTYFFRSHQRRPGGELDGRSGGTLYGETLEECHVILKPQLVVRESRDAKVR